MRNCLTGCTAVHGATDGFLHGVASFDPLPHAVIIWTRYTPSELEQEVAVDWLVSERKGGEVVASGKFVTGPSRDFTVAVDVGGLKPGTRYAYRFQVGSALSPQGLTKTAAEGRLEELLFGLCSCANWGFGYFHVYDLLRRVDSLDFICHAGDYIYEYEKGEYPGRSDQGRHGLRPKHRCKTLSDYRCRYACYRGDPALQELHRKVPFIVVWDDHEVADSAYKSGSEDFKGGKKRFQAMKCDALRAHAEWLPIRGMSVTNPDPAGCHRTFQFGDLASLILVENRLSSRGKPVEVSESAFYAATARKDMADWDDDAALAGKRELMEALRDPERKMLGDEQVADVGRAVRESVAAGQPWQIMVSQTILSRVNAPRLTETVGLQPKALRWLSRKALGVATNPKRAGEEGAEMARMYVGMGRYGVPMNPDAWDGYQAERERVLEALNVPGSNPVILAGDSHNAWAQEVTDDKGQRVAVEFDGPAVTAIGAFEDIYSRFEHKMGVLSRLVPLWLFTPWLQDALKAANPETLRYANLHKRGCVLVHVGRRRLHAEYHYVDQVHKSPAYKNHCEAAFYVEAGEKGRLHSDTRFLCVDGAIPKRTRPKRGMLLHAVHDLSLAMHKWQYGNS